MCELCGSKIGSAVASKWVAKGCTAHSLEFCVVCLS